MTNTEDLKDLKDLKDSKDWTDDLLTSAHAYLVSNNATNLLSKLLYPKQIAMVVYPCPFDGKGPCQCRFGMAIPTADLSKDPFYKAWLDTWGDRLKDFKKTVFSSYPDIPDDHFNRFVYLCSS